MLKGNILVEVKENNYDITLACYEDADIAIVYKQSPLLRIFFEVKENDSKDTPHHIRQKTEENILVASVIYK